MIDWVLLDIIHEFIQWGVILLLYLLLRFNNSVKKDSEVRKRAEKWPVPTRCTCSSAGYGKEHVRGEGGCVWKSDDSQEEER